MLSKPIFKSTYHPEILNENEVVLIDERHGVHVLNGKMYTELTELILKKLSTDEIIKKLEGKYSIEMIYYALMRLQNKKYIFDEEQLLSGQGTQQFCDLLEIDTKKAKERLSKHTLSITTLCQDLPLEGFKNKLNSLSLAIGDASDLEVVLCDDYRDPELLKINERALKTKKKWLLVVPYGSEIILGPLFVPGNRGCYNCLLERLSTIYAIEAFAVEKQLKYSKPLPIPKLKLATSCSLAFDILANELFKYVVKGNDSELIEKVLSFDILETKLTRHHFGKSSTCLICNEKETESSFRPVELQSRPKPYIKDGGHREVHPKETIKKYKHLVSPLTGVVRSIGKVEMDAPHLHVYHAVHSLNTRCTDKFRLGENLFNNSAGKGKTEAQSEASCLGEAIERLSGRFYGTEYIKKASYKDLKNEAIHPYSILRFSEHQYDIREIHNKDCSGFHYIPERFDENEVVSWTPVWSLTENRKKYIPTGLCYYSYTADFEKTKFATGCSNGAASGNNIEEAIIQGFFELVERDACAMWWYSRLNLPEVDLSTFEDPYIELLRESYKKLGRKFWVIDITMDIKVPTFVAFSSTIDKSDKLVFGFGSHFDPMISMLRALSEMNQSIPLCKASKEGDSKTRRLGAMLDWYNTESVTTQPYVLPDYNLPKKKFSDFETIITNDSKEDVLQCQKLVEEKGLEMLVLDQTREELGLPSVKVFVPGLRHFWNRYAPGRLYDIPYQLGLVSKKLTEEELNPIPIFF